MTCTAIILAGGLGTRLRSVVSEVPKPLAPVAGRPFLEWQMEAWHRQGVGRFVLSVGYRHELIRERIGDRFRSARVEYVVEREPLGTGGGALLALDTCADERDVVLLNGDTWFDVSLADLTARAEQTHADWCIALFQADQANRYGGVSSDPDGRIRGLGVGSAKVGEWANGGVYWLRTSVIRALALPRHVRCSLEGDLFRAAVSSEARIIGFHSASPFLDIGVPADYARASGIVAQSER